MIYPLFLIDALKEGFIGILLTLDTIIYSLISSSFKVFMAIAGARLLSSDAYFEIANKVYILVGVIMLFVLSYAILKAIVDPDNASKGEFGPKMIKNVVIAVIGLAVSPVIFNFMYQAQGLILEQDVLGKIFFRIENTDSVNTSGTVEVGDDSVNVSTSVNPDEYVKEIGGAVTAVNLWQAFFSPSEDSGKEASEIVASADDYFISAAGYGALCAGLGVAAVASAAIPVVGWIISPLAAGAAIVSCAASVIDVANGVQTANQIDGDISLEEAYAMASAGEGFGIFTVFLKNYVDDGEITYLFGISTIAGAFALYAFVSFSIDMGIRAAKLAYLQIIAPIPLVMQVLPKYKKSFDNYIGLVVSTFMEVFIRISVVYVVVYIICHLTEMFSSASLWGNDALNVAEKLFALAFLILGLIAFCRKAPEFITNSLGLKKGDMHLGIGKKLADGGFYAGKSIIGGGVTAGVRNWRNGTKEKMTEADRRARALSTLAGFGSGSARATALNFGPGHKPADTWRQSRDIAENAAQAANDARDTRDTREKRHEEAVSALSKARQIQAAALRDFTTKEQALAAARASGDQAAINAAKTEYDAAEAALKSADDAVAKARKETLATTAVGNAANEAAKRIDAWSIGTVSTAKEEANIKFGSALDKAKTDARNEAYKKDNASKAFKQQLETLEATKISEYREGWDDQSYNEAIRQRINAELTDLRSKQEITALARNDVIKAQEALDTARASGASAQQLATLQADLDSKKNALTAAQTTELDATTALNTARIAATESVDVIAKRSEGELAQARMDLQSKLKATRDAMEAAADAYVARELGDETSNVYTIYQDLLNDNAAYIAENLTTKFTVDKNGTQRTVQEIISSAFGDAAAAGGGISTSTASGQNSFDLTVNGSTVTFNYDTREKINNQPNPNYKKYVSSDGSTVYGQEEFFNHVFEVLDKDKTASVKAKTASATSADEGKFASKHIRTSREYVDKVTRKRQAQENKGGKK